MINRLKGYVLQLGDPYPYSYPPTPTEALKQARGHSWGPKEYQFLAEEVADTERQSLKDKIVRYC